MPLPPSNVHRVASYYRPVADWCAVEIAKRRARSPVSPVIIGINGPQGAGKSTLAAAIVSLLGESGYRGIALSIDDFYLTHEEQCALAARYPGNPFLAYRGYPGTHDVALGLATLDALLAGRDTLVPCYDKSAHGGRGDRAPQSAWRPISGALDFVLFEGWMLGFSPVSADAGLTDTGGQRGSLLQIPHALLSAYAPWNELIDAMVILGASSLEDIVEWRIDSERARRERGEVALSHEEARDYIERFLPAYRAWVPGLRAHPPGEAQLFVNLGPDRMPVRIGLTASGEAATLGNP